MGLKLSGAVQENIEIKTRISERLRRKMPADCISFYIKNKGKVNVHFDSKSNVKYAIIDKKLISIYRKMIKEKNNGSPAELDGTQMDVFITELRYDPN